MEPSGAKSDPRYTENGKNGEHFWIEVEDACMIVSLVRGGPPRKQRCCLEGLNGKGFGLFFSASKQVGDTFVKNILVECRKRPIFKSNPYPGVYCFQYLSQRLNPKNDRSISVADTWTSQKYDQMTTNLIGTAVRDGEP